jgi:hypothetical protein
MSLVRLLTLAILGLPLAQLSCRKQSAPTVERAELAGWEAIALRNRAAEVVVVPTIGRIMQFRWRSPEAGAPGGPFWNHPGLDPKLPADENGWVNAGGDKAWPAPQSAWPAMVGRAWPPPKTFDAVPFGMSIAGRSVRLVSPVDPNYGIRVERTISLDPAEPVMTVETTYEKVQGAPVQVAVWSITQLEVPDRLFVRLPPHSTFPHGYALRLPDPPKDLRTDGRLLSLTRDPSIKSMLGSDGDALLWVGAQDDLLVENVTAEPGDPTPAAAPAWPDGAHAQVYTSQGHSEQYVETELLGRLRELRPGDHTSMTARYTLKRRIDADPMAEARAVFGEAVVRGAASPADKGP